MANHSNATLPLFWLRWLLLEDSNVSWNYGVDWNAWSALLLFHPTLFRRCSRRSMAAGCIVLLQATHRYPQRRPSIDYLDTFSTIQNRNVGKFYLVAGFIDDVTQKRLTPTWRQCKTTIGNFFICTLQLVRVNELITKLHNIVGHSILFA